MFKGCNLQIKCCTLNELINDFDKYVDVDEYDPKDLAETLQSIIKSIKLLHGKNPVIIFLDEIYETESYNLMGFDYSNNKNDNFNILMTFNPILQTHHSYYLNVSVESSHSNQKIGVPNLLTKTLTKRYRNSEKIQKLTKFVGDEMNIYLKTTEEFASCIPGKHPVWIDLGFKNIYGYYGFKKRRVQVQNLENALSKILKLMDCNDVRLLYDGHFEDEVRSLLTKRKLKHFKKNIIELYLQ